MQRQSYHARKEPFASPYTQKEPFNPAAARPNGSVCVQKVAGYRRDVDPWPLERCRSPIAAARPAVAKSTIMAR